MMIDVSSASSPAWGSHVPDKIFHLILQFLKTDLETHRKEVQLKFNSHGWRNLFGDPNFYSARCEDLDKECRLARLSWQLVCKEWFLLSHHNYDQVQRLAKTAMRLQEKINQHSHRL